MSVDCPMSLLVADILLAIQRIFFSRCLHVTSTLFGSIGSPVNMNCYICTGSTNSLVFLGENYQWPKCIFGFRCGCVAKTWQLYFFF